MGQWAFWAFTVYNQYMHIYNIQLYGLSIWIIINGLNLMGYIQIHTVFCHPGVDRIWTIPYSTTSGWLHTYIIFIYIHIYIYIIQLNIKLNFGAPNSAFLRPGAHGPVEPEAFGSAGPHRLLGAAPTCPARATWIRARTRRPGGGSKRCSWEMGRILGKSPSEIPSGNLT